MGVVVGEDVDGRKISWTTPDIRPTKVFDKPQPYAHSFFDHLKYVSFISHLIFINRLCIVYISYLPLELPKFKLQTHQHLPLRKPL